MAEPDAGTASLLFGRTPPPASPRAQPECFPDLSLDKVVAAVTAGRGDYQLTPFLYLPLTDPDLVRYRQEVFTDLRDDGVLAALRRFAEDMKHVHGRLRTQARAYNQWQRSRLFLNAAALYCQTVEAFADALTDSSGSSRALHEAAAFLAEYMASDRFSQLRRDTTEMLDALGEIRYCVLLRGDKITVEHYDGEPTLTEQVLDTFARFRHGATKDYHTKLPHPHFDQISAFTLDLVARLFPAPFAQLEKYCAVHAEFIEPTVERFEREVQFYLGFSDYLRPLHRAGLNTTIPKLGERAELCARDTFDLALAADLTSHETTVVTNDVELSGAERILVVSGPNQGGKTTLARTVGQLHYLAALGCPVPGTDVTLALPDAIYTHFERQEDIANLAGKLEDDLIRIKTILDRATASSVVILNEIFTSTTLDDARFLSRTILDRVSDLDALCVCVTFIDELARLNDKTVSMVSVVDPDDPAIRTLKVMRRPADGRAYALALARKYGLTYEQLAARVRS